MPRTATKRTTKTAVRKSAAQPRRVAGAAKSARTPVKSTGRSMSAGHKAALAQGRCESRAINQYLDALDTGPAKRGRRRTPTSIDARLARIEASLRDATHLKHPTYAGVTGEIAYSATGPDFTMPRIRSDPTTMQPTTDQVRIFMLLVPAVSTTSTSKVNSSP
jgi:hypothetical protein